MSIENYLAKKKSPIKDAAGNLITDSGLQANILRNYFASVFTKDNGESRPFTRRTCAESDWCCDVNFTPLKLMQVLKALKATGFYGPDGFPCVMLKNWLHIYASHLHFCFSHHLHLMCCRLVGLMSL